MKLSRNADHPNPGGLPRWAWIALGVGAVTLIASVAGIANEQSLPDFEHAADPNLRQSPQPGDILLFYRPRRGRDYFIRWLTRSPFYHAALFAGDNTVVEARPAGVGHNDLAGREDGFVVIPAPEARGAAALAWAKTQIGDKFDRKDFLVIWLEHVFVGWHINYAPPGRYTCAELITAAFRQAGFDPFPGEENSEIDPGDWAKYLPHAEV